MKIFFDGYELDRRYVKALSQSAEAFNGTFKLGSTICRAFELEISKECTLLELLQCEDGSPLLTEDGLPLRVEQDMDITTYRPQKIRLTDDMEKVYATLRLDDIDTEDDYILSYKLTDEMVMLNQEFVYDTSQTHTVQELLNMICTSHGMKLATTSLYLADMPISWGGENMTERDFVSYVAEVNCGYAFINKDGNLEFKSYTNTPSAEIDVRNCSSFKVGYHHIYDRVYLELGTATYYYPETSDHDTLYLNPENILFTSGGKYPYTEVMAHMYNQIKGFNFYNIEANRCPIPNTLCCETVVFNLSGTKYPTLWQVAYDYNVHWYGGLSCILEGSEQEETKIKNPVDKVNKKVNYLKITVDRELGSIKEEIKTTTEKITAIDKNAIFTVMVMYALSTSNTVAPTDGWSEDAPKPESGQFLWQKTKTVYGDGTVSYSTPTCIQGTDGKDGHDGVDGKDGLGIKDVVDQYYLSTSNTELIGGEWLDTCPSWSKDHYIWSRSKITWSDNTITYTTPIVSSALNDANEKADNTYQTLITYYSTTEQTDSKIALSVSGIKTDILGEVETTYATKASLEVYVTEDEAKNSIASWINACADNIVLNASSKLVFGDLNNQYITISNYSDVNGNKVGVLFDGTGQIMFTPSGAFDVRNIISGTLKNQFQISALGASNNVSIWNNHKNNESYYANSITMGSQAQVDGSYNNSINLYNYVVGSNQNANYISMSNNGSNKYLKIDNDGSRNRLWLTRSGNNTHLQLGNYSTNAGSDIYSNVLEFDSSSGVLMFNFEYGYPGNFNRTAVTGMKMYNVDFNINSKDDLRLTASGLLYLNSSEDYVTKIWYNGAKLTKAITISADQIFIKAQGSCYRVTGMTNGCLAVESVPEGNQSESSGGKYRCQKVNYKQWA